MRCRIITLITLFVSINCMQQRAFHTHIPYLKLNDGNKIPAMGFGTLLLTGESGRQAIIRAVEAGLRYLDTASYYNNEEDVGTAVAELIRRGVVTREEMFISTKLWNYYHDRDQVVPQLQKSLKKLGLDYVDMYLIHTPMALAENGSFLYTDYVETWRGMEDAKRLGLTKSIGLSNFNSRQINRILVYGTIKPAVNQIEGNPSYPNIPLIAYCQQKGIVVETFSPLGFLVPRGRETTEAIGPEITNPVLVGIAQKYGKTVFQVVLRYAIDRGVVPIPRTRNETHLLENVNIFDFNLTEREVDRINEFDCNTKVYTLANYVTHLYYGIYTP